MAITQLLKRDEGRLLASLRQKAHLTQSELARQAGVSRSMIAQLEMGKRHPSQKLLRILCQTMDVTAEEERRLFLAYGMTPPGQTPEQIAAWLHADEHLTSEQAEQIADMVRQAYREALRATEMQTPEEVVGKVFLK